MGCLLTDEEIAEFIASNYELFAGHKRLTIISMSGFGGYSSSYYSREGPIIYTGHRGLPFRARLVEENGVFGITSMQIDSTETRMAKIISIEDIGDIPVVGMYRRFVAERQKKY
jgi:hypothetical protein